jgi:hypothetical protein
MRELIHRALGRVARAAAPEPALDAVVVGYPKSGNTWLRMLLGRYAQLLHGLAEMPLFDGTERAQPGLAGYPGPFFRFTHEPLEWRTQTAADLSDENVVAPFAGLRVVLLTRYPIDVLVSLFMQQKYTRNPYPYPGTLEELVDDPVYGLDKFLRFHLLWDAGATRTAAFRLARYEDLRRDAETEAGAIARFLGFALEEKALREAVAYAAFDSMKSMQGSGHVPTYPSSGLGVFGPIDPAEPRSNRVRSGTVGGYRAELAAETCARLERRIREALPARYGYAQPPA